MKISLCSSPETGHFKTIFLFVFIFIKVFSLFLFFAYLASFCLPFYCFFFFCVFVRLPYACFLAFVWVLSTFFVAYSLRILALLSAKDENKHDNDIYTMLAKLW